MHGGGERSPGDLVGAEECVRYIFRGARESYRFTLGPLAATELTVALVSYAAVRCVIGRRAPHWGRETGCTLQ